MSFNARLRPTLVVLSLLVAIAAHAQAPSRVGPGSDSPTAATAAVAGTSTTSAMVTQAGSPTGFGVTLIQNDTNSRIIRGGTSVGIMIDHNGPVQHTQKIFTIFWNPTGPAFPSDYQTTINQFVQDLNGSSYYAIASQYNDTTSDISTALSYGGTWLDTTNAFPHTALTGDDLLQEVNRAKAAMGWTSDANSYFQIYTPNGISNSITSICGAHYFFNPAFGHILFPQSGCLPGSTYPNNAAVDAAINVSAHEIMETVTDPLGNAWYYVDTSGEIGDLCNFTFGSRATDGSNVTLAGHKYIIQQEWSNASSGCALSYTSTKPAAMLTPAPGSTLPGSMLTFQWTSGTGVTQYWLYAGTTIGGADLFYQGEGTSLSQTVTGLPTNGGPIYVRLWSLIGGAWLFNDYTYTAATDAAARAQMTTPGPGSTLTGSTVSFQWTSGTAVTQHWLYAGTTIGGADLFYQGEGTSLGQTVTGLPTNGSTLYVRLWSLIGGAWLFNDYTYTAATAARAQMTTPAPGSTLTASSVPFQWTGGTGVSQYWLYVGTTLGSADLFYRGEGTNLSQTVTGLPTNGSTLYVRLWSLIGGAWLFNDYPYIATTPSAQMVTPVPGSMLTAAVVPFHWTGGTGVSQYWLYVGTTLGGANLFYQGEGTNLSQTVTGLPTNGSLVYVRLWSLISGAWLFNDYAYTAVTPQAQITTPAPGATLLAAAVPFQWTSGTGVAQYWLYAGTTVGGADLFYQNEGTSLSQTVTGLPTNGGTVYVRLWSLISGAWLFNDYAYTAVTPQAQMTTPAQASKLTGSTEWFQWTRGTALTGYWLYVGTTVGGSNLFSQSEGLNQGGMVTGLPTNGSPVYVRLWSLTGGGWQFNDYTYTAH